MHIHSVYIDVDTDAYMNICIYKHICVCTYIHRERDAYTQCLYRYGYRCIYEYMYINKCMCVCTYIYIERERA